MKNKRSWNPKTADKAVSFLNLVNSPEELARAVHDDPQSGKASSAYGLGLKLASKLLKEKEKLGGKFADISQIDGIRGMGDDKMNDLFYSMEMTNLDASDYLKLHDPEFKASLIQNAEKQEECTSCQEKSGGELHDEIVPEKVKKDDAQTNVGVIGAGLANAAPNPCGVVQMNESWFQPDMQTPVKTVRVNLVIMQKQDGTANFNEFDPNHNNLLDIAESTCNFMYRDVASQSGGNCNQMSDSKVQFEFNRIYIRHENLWNLDENWTQNNGNPISPYACPNLNGNWPWRPLYETLRSQEECKQEAITIFLVNSGTYLDDIRKHMQYFPQPAGSPAWLLPAPNYNLTNWSTHSPWVGGCSSFPSNNPHNPGRGHVILCKNSYYDYLRMSRVQFPTPQPINWMIGHGLGHLLAHEIGHMVMQMFHKSSGSCGTNMMNNGGWQSYLDQGQLRRLHRVLSCTDMRRAVEEDHQELIITHDQVWDRNVKMFGNIRIRSGNRLQITCEVEMPTEGRIIVEQGAVLEVNEGRIVSRCEQWGGIEVQGNAKKAHPSLSAIKNGSFPNAADDHGLLILEKATLENAAHSVSLVGSASWGVDMNLSGGIIIAEHSSFTNVRRAVEFMAFEYDNVSQFTNCTFEIDPGKALYFKIDPMAFVTMWAVKGVQFKGNTFINRDSSGTDYPLANRGRAIYSIDASYSITPFQSLQGTVLKNKFINLTQAVESIATHHNYLGINIQDAIFDNNYRSIIMQGITGVFVRDLECLIGSELSWNSDEYAYGVQFTHCEFAWLHGSEFGKASGSTGSQYGIRYLNCGKSLNLVYDNSFTGLTCGLRSVGDNSGLQIKCNDFETILGDLYLDRDLPSLGAGSIGSLQVSFPYTGTANNQFSPIPCSNPGHHVHFDPMISQPFKYIVPNSTNLRYTPSCFVNGTPALYFSKIGPKCTPGSIFKAQSKDEYATQVKQLLSSLDEKQAAELMKSIPTELSEAHQIALRAESPKDLPGLAELPKKELPKMQGIELDKGGSRITEMPEETRANLLEVADSNTKASVFAQARLQLERFVTKDEIIL